MIYEINMMLRDLIDEIKTSKIEINYEDGSAPGLSDSSDLPGKDLGIIRSFIKLSEGTEISCQQTVSITGNALEFSEPQYYTYNSIEGINSGCSWVYTTQYMPVDLIKLAREYRPNLKVDLEQLIKDRINDR